MLARLVAVRSRHYTEAAGRMRKVVVGSYYSLLTVVVLLLVWEQSHQSRHTIHHALHCCFGKQA